MEKIEKFDSSKYLLHLVYTPITRSNKMKKHKICSKCGKNHNEWIKGTHCKNCRSLSQKVCYEKNKKHYTENANRYYQNNKKDKLEYAKKYRLKNKDKYKDYFAKNAEQIYKRRALREKERRENDISFRIQCNLRSRLRNALNGKKKLKHCIDLFGCTNDELIKHIESLWKDGMNWENYGIDGWHIDHIKPCSSFDMSKEEDQLKCFHYSNLQPLWALENKSKGDTFNQLKKDLYVEKMKLLLV